MSQISPRAERPVVYSDEEVKGILEQALGLDGREFDRADLVVMARQLGIPEERLAQAEQAYFARVDDISLEREFVLTRRRQFLQNLARWLVMCAAAFVAYFSGIFILPAIAVIAAFPLMFGGITLLYEGVSAFFNTTGDEFDKAFDAWLEKRETRQRRRLPSPS